MNDPRNITILILLAAAAILTALLVGNYTTLDAEAYADESVKQGDYIIGTGTRSEGTDLLYVIDIATRRLNVYETDVNNWTNELRQSVNLERAFRQ